MYMHINFIHMQSDLIYPHTYTSVQDKSADKVRVLDISRCMPA